MRWVLALAIVTATAHAQPDAFEACKQRRRELTSDAMAVADPVARGRMLAAMPVCRRFEDGSSEVVEHATTAPDTTSYHPLVLAVRLGLVGISGDATGELVPNVGAGPAVEVQAGYRFSRAWSVAGVARAAEVIDHVAVTNTDFVNDAMQTTLYDRLIGGELRVDRYERAMWFGAGIGADYEHLTDAHFGTNGVVTNHVLRTVELHLGTTVARTHYGDVQLMVEVSESGLLGSGRELLAGMVAIGAAL